MAFSSIGKTKLAAQALIFILNIVVLAVADRVNKFNEFFYVADLLPLAGSILTLIALLVIIVLDFATQRSPLGGPLVEAGITGVLTIFWLAFSSFSSSRWKYIPKKCNTISVASSAERGWCKDTHTLEGFMWLMFVLTLAFTLTTVIYTVMQYRQGNRHVFKTPFSQYDPDSNSSDSTFVTANAFNANGTLFNPAMYDKDPIYGGRIPAGPPAAAGKQQKPDWYVNGNYGAAAKGSGNMYAISEKDETVSQMGDEQRRSEYDGYEKGNPFERMPPVSGSGGFAGVGGRKVAAGGVGFGARTSQKKNQDAAALW